MGFGQRGVAAVDVTDDIRIGFKHHIFVDHARARNRRAAGVNGALDAIFARPRDHLFGFIPGLDRAQADFAQQRHPRIGQIFEVLFGHALFNDRRTGHHLHSAGAKVVKGALGGDGQGFEAHDVFGPPRQMHFARRDHGGHAAIHGRVDPADLVLARRPVAEHRVHMAVDQAGADTGLVCINGGLCARQVAIFLTPHRNDQAVVDHDGVGLQDGLINIARQQQANVFDHDFSRCASGGDVGHGGTPQRAG